MTFSPARAYTRLTARLHRLAAGLRHADGRGGVSVEGVLVCGVLITGLVPGAFAARSLVTPASVDRGTAVVPPADCPPAP